MLPKDNIESLFFFFIFLHVYIYIYTGVVHGYIGRNTRFRMAVDYERVWSGKELRSTDELYYELITAAVRTRAENAETRDREKARSFVIFANEFSSKRNRAIGVVGGGGTRRTRPNRARLPERRSPERVGKTFRAVCKTFVRSVPSTGCPGFVHPIRASKEIFENYA